MDYELWMNVIMYYTHIQYTTHEEGNTYDYVGANLPRNLILLVRCEPAPNSSMMGFLIL